MLRKIKPNLYLIVPVIVSLVLMVLTISAPAENPVDLNSIKNSPMVNINSANQMELETLPGIGPSKARRIIEYREKQGGSRGIMN